MSGLMNFRIDVKIIPHNEHRYETCGDYWWSEDNSVLHVRVSELGNPIREWLIAQHEIQEAVLGRLAGIPEPECAAFDVGYEKAREMECATPCGCLVGDEPGFDPHSPYYLQHKIADTCERVTALALDVDWADYERQVYSLSKE